MLAAGNLIAVFFFAGISAAFRTALRPALVLVQRNWCALRVSVCVVLVCVRCVCLSVCANCHLMRVLCGFIIDEAELHSAFTFLDWVSERLPRPVISSLLAMPCCVTASFVACRTRTAR